MSDYKTTWDFSNKHVDSSIDKDSFISAARSVIYAGKSGREATTFHRIGVIQSYSWGEQRGVEMIFELGSDIPYLVPGRTVGNISLSRILIFGKDLTNLFYQEGEGIDVEVTDENKITSLKDIKSPLDLMFATYNNSDNNLAYSRVFSTCWIESRSESISAGQILLAENVSIRYQDIVNAEFTSGGQ